MTFFTGEVPAKTGSGFLYGIEVFVTATVEQAKAETTSLTHDDMGNYAAFRISNIVLGVTGFSFKPRAIPRMIVDAIAGSAHK